MILRRRRTPSETWANIVTRVGDVPHLSSSGHDVGDSAAVAAAREYDRWYDDTADVLARIERDVAEPDTRAALDTMIESRRAERLELEDLEDIPWPDNETRLDTVFDVWWLCQWSSLFLVAYLPSDRSLSVPLAIAAAISVITLAGALAVHRRRRKEDIEWRIALFFLAGSVAGNVLVAAARTNLADAFPELGPVSIASLGTLAGVALTLALLGLVTPTERAHLRAIAEHNPDDPWLRISNRIQELHDTLEEDGPARLGAALATRDPAVARATRPIVIEAIRVLLEREQIDKWEAEWMILEALDRG